MSRNDRHLPSKYHDKKCSSYYTLQRLYVRKSVTRKKPKFTPGYSNDSRAVSEHFHGTGQMYVGVFWHCSGCGLIVSDPVQCPKCKSKDVINGKNDDYSEKSNYDYWHCRSCRFKWKVKVRKLKINKVEIR